MNPFDFQQASAGNYELEKALRQLESKAAFEGSHIYYVIQKSKAFAAYFLQEHQKQYNDGSLAVYTDPGDGTGIQAAINACRGGRGDYIIVGTGSYQLTTALTLSGKSSVHLLAVNGLTSGIGTVGAALLQQTGDYQCLILEAYDEVAGFQFINKAGYAAITMADGKWRPSVHNNYFHMVQGTACTIIQGVGTGFTHGFICNNRFQTWVSGAITAAIALATGNSVTIQGNSIVNYSGTMDKAIDLGGGVQNLAVENLISDCGGAGTITLGIDAGTPTGNVVVGNKIALPTGTGLAGGTADRTFVQNYDAENGGATPIET
jgi:hypothetical protein